MVSSRVMLAVVTTALAVVHAFPVYIYKHSGNFTIGIVEYHCECCGVSYLYYLGNRIIGVEKVVIYATSRCGKLTFEIIAHELTHSIGHVDSEYIAEYTALYITYRYFDHKLPLALYLKYTLLDVDEDIENLVYDMTKPWGNITLLVEKYYIDYADLVKLDIKENFTTNNPYRKALLDFMYDLTHGKVKQYLTIHKTGQIVEWSYRIYKVWLSLKNGEQAILHVR